MTGGAPVSDVPSLVHAKRYQTASTHETSQSQSTKAHPSDQTGFMIKLSGTGLSTVLTPNNTAFVLEKREWSPWSSSRVNLGNGFSNVVTLADILGILGIFCFLFSPEHDARENFGESHPFNGNLDAVRQAKDQSKFELCRPYSLNYHVRYPYAMSYMHELICIHIDVLSSSSDTRGIMS